MAEEPVTNDELFDGEDVSTKTPKERLQGYWQSLREKFAEGGVLTLVFLFVIGAVFGAAAKAVASRSILIGYWDYTISPKEKSAVNLNAVQQELAARQKEASKPEESTEPAPQAEDSGNNNESASNQDESTEELPPLPPTPEPPASPEGAIQE